KFTQGVSRTTAAAVEGVTVNSAFLKKLDAKMRELIDKDADIVRFKLSKEEAIKLYLKQGYNDKIEALKYRPEDTVNIYQCENYYNYLYGYMLPSMGYLNKYKLIQYYPNFLIAYPRSELKGRIPRFEDSPSFGRMVREAQNWAINCECDDIVKLNSHATQDSVIDLVNMCEAKHNNMLAELGLIIKENIENIRLIAIAGPSSSGKTTFSHRLRIELMTRGIRPLKISIDDYYLDKSQAPKDEHGKPDLEHINAIDIELFNQHLVSLIDGEEVQLPHFNFKLGKRVLGEKIKIAHNQPIIIEGIHALNEKLTTSIPKHQKFKIYISPLSQINIDDHSQINATEIRQLRRIVRDAKYRQTLPSATFAMWASVRRGEFKWIYPFQEEADYIYNSELTYELGVMRKYALPVLEAIDRNDEFFVDANRIVKFLKLIKEIDEKFVPCNSLLREFIGDSCFY
ncbi:MAG: nucleoside kinase, partial [Bacilli bacterium]